MFVKCLIHNINILYLQNLVSILAFKGYAKKTWHIYDVILQVT